jgi:hypothetical protein
VAIGAHQHGGGAGLGQPFLQGRLPAGEARIIQTERGNVRRRCQPGRIA